MILSPTGLFQPQKPGKIRLKSIFSLTVKPRKDKPFHKFPFKKTDGVSLKKSKENNSTQKLLDLIRTGEKKQAIKFVAEDSQTSFDSNTSLPLSTKPKNLNLGVWITPRNITLVMTSNKGFAKNKGLVKWQVISLPEILFPENLLPENHEFPVFLKNCLDNFLGDQRKVSIWCALKSSNMKIRNIIIPDIPQNKIANAAFWGLKKEMEFNEDQEIFNFEILEDINIDGNKKKNILVFSAPRNEISSLEKTFHEAGYFLTGITSIPFAMQNFVRTGQILVDNPYFAIVNISRENSETYCFSQSGILLVRTLRTGSQNLIEELNTPLDMDPIDHLSSLTKTNMDEFSQIKEISERLISKIVRTGEYCAQHYTGNTPINQYIFYGEIDQCELFMNQASTMIPAVVETFKPLRDGLSNSIEADFPKDAKQRNTVLTAFGIALSSNDITPNFLFTFDDQQKVKKQKKTILTTVLAGIFLIALAFSTNFLLNFTLQKNFATLDQLNREQIKFGKEIQTETITQAISLAEAKNSDTKQYINNYLPLAIIYDLCHFTPDHIHLSSMTYDLKKDKNLQNTETKKLFVQGRVSGHSHFLNSELGNYILKLSESPVFGDIEITSKQIKQTDQDKTLFFKATLEVL